MADPAARRGGSCEGGRAEEMGGGLASGGPGLFFTEGEVCRLASGCSCRGGGLPPGLEAGVVWQLLPCEGLAGGCRGSGAWCVAGGGEAVVGVGTGMGSSVSAGVLLRYQCYLSRACSTMACCCQLWLK